MIRTILTITAIFLSLVFFYFTLPSQVLGACKDQKPGGIPVITSTTPSDGSVTLTWIEAADPVSYYLVAYGTARGLFEYGSSNIGGKGTTSYTVTNLKNEVRYYFRVRAGNGCRPGNFSDTVSAVPRLETRNVIGFPNLAITNPVLGEDSTAPTIYTKSETVLGASDNLKDIKPVRCSSCKAWPYLLGEVVILVLFFYLVYVSKISFLHPITSLLIPVVTYLLFSYGQGSCTAANFFCRYFLLLDMIIFILIAITQKQIFFSNQERKTKASVTR